MKLYEISGELMKLENALEDSGEGPHDELALEKLAETYFAKKDEFDDKVASCGKLMLMQESQEVMVKNEVDRLTKRLKAMKNKREWLKSYLKNHMIANNVLKLKFPEVTVSVQKNPDSVEIEYVEKLPEKFMQKTITFTPKKKEIKEALKAGEKVEGARLITDKTNLRIK